MLWLIQNNYVERNTGPIAEYVRTSGGEIFDFSAVTGEPLPAFPLNPNEKHFFCGSTQLLDRLSSDVSWAPYVFQDKDTLDQRNWVNNRGADMLNGDCETMTLAEFEQVLSTREDWVNGVFVRPTHVGKAFNGHVSVDGDLSTIYTDRRGYPRLQDPKLLVSTSPVKVIKAEYRFIVLNNELKLGSSYRVDGAFQVSSDIPDHVWQGASELAKGWMPGKFVVMDVAVREDGSMCIVEFNGVQSAGLYGISIPAFVELVESVVNEAFN